MSNVREALLPCLPDMESALALIGRSLATGGKILACGNGGSASDAEHIVGELMKGFNLKRPLDAGQVAQLEACLPGEGHAIAAGLQQALPAISLVSQNALITAIANDTDPQMIFAQQVLGLGKPGDVLLGLSTSGNSRNVVLAAKVAKAFGLKVVALTGQGGGLLAPLADVAIRVPASHVAEIQELHLPVYHWLCAKLEEQFFGGDPAAKPKPGGVLPGAIGLLVFDFDGVFTDNKVYTAQDGSEMVLCDRSDGLGLDHLRAAGIPMLILSTEANPVVAARARKVQLPVSQACGNKALWLRQHIEENKLEPSSIVYVGNDLNDLGAMEVAGFTVAPADAHPEIRRRADLVLTSAGGHGAVRELCDHILKARG